MCLTLLSSRYFTMGFVGEYIFLDLSEDGRLQPTEVYDYFFTLPFDWLDAKLVFVSPHSLLSDEGIAVRAMCPATRKTPEEEIIYSHGGGYRDDWNEETRVLSVTVYCGKEPLDSCPEDFLGLMLSPSIHLPQTLTDSAVGRQLMSRCGTVFELELGSLQAHQEYAFRLEVKPYKLLQIPEPSKREGTWLKYYGIPSGHYSQNLSVYSPRTAYNDFVSFLKGVKEREEFREVASNCLSVVSDPILTLVPFARHRIVVLGPPDADIEQREQVGGIWLSESCAVWTGAKQRAFLEWGSGAKTYWADDIESLSRRVYDHLKQWASGEPKTKEEITASLNAYHPNVSLVVNALVGKGILRQIGRTYQAVEQAPAVFERAVAEISTEIKDYRYRGYEIAYDVSYEYLSNQDTKKLRWLKLKNDVAFWLAVVSLIVGVLLGILGLLL